MKKLCLVTGGAGFIGSNLVRRLIESGYAVRVLDNFATGRRENLTDVATAIDLQEGDLRDPAAIAKAMRGVRYVFHLGALPSVARSIVEPLPSHEVNATGTLNLLLQAREEKVERFVFASSSSVYGDTPVLPKHEGLCPAPLSPYALSKLTSEYYCQLFHSLYGLPTFALRYFNVFGPRQDPTSQYSAVIPIFINKIQHNQSPTIYGDGEQSRDFTFIENVVAANLCCCTAPLNAAGKAYNVACGERITINQLVAQIAAILGKDVAPIYAVPRPGDIRDSLADSRLAMKDLGWQPSVTFADGLKRTIAWYQEVEKC